MHIASAISIGSTISVGGAVNPILQLSPFAWYDASSIEQADNTAVSTWADLSGNGYDATQAVSGSRPTLKLNQINSQAAILFDGSGDNLVVSSSTSAFKFLHSNTSTVFIIGQPGTSASVDALYAFYGNSAGSQNASGVVFYWDDRLNYTNRILHQISRGATGLTSSNIQDNSEFLVNSFHNVQIITDATNATANQRSKIKINNGTLVNNNTLTSAASSADATYDFQIGAHGNSLNFLNGYIAEIIIFNRILTSDEITTVNNYFNSKYAL